MSVATELDIHAWFHENENCMKLRIAGGLTRVNNNR